MYQRSMFFGKNMKIVKKIQMKIVIFTPVKIHCILHGRVVVMPLDSYSILEINLTKRERISTLL